MLKKRKRLLICNISIIQISLVVFSIFSFAFIIGGGEIVSAAGPDARAPLAAGLLQPGSGGRVVDIAQGIVTPGGDASGVISRGSISYFNPSKGISQTALRGDYFVKGTNEGYRIFNSKGILQADNVIDISAAENTQAIIPKGGGPAGNAGATADKGIGEVLSDIANGKAFGGGTPGHLVSGLVWGAVAGGIAYFVADLFGASADQSKAIGTAVGVGTAVARFGFLQAQALQTGEKQLFGGLFKSLGFTNSGNAFLWGVGISAAIFVLTYKEEEQKRVEYQCLPWEAPIGGQNCEVCNNDEFKPCSEYRCRSLGQACEIVNAGTTEEKCVWVNPRDVTSPTITPWDEPLSDGHSYLSHKTRPPALGTRIVNDDSGDGCIAAFTPLEFGFITNEPAQCKADIVHRDTLDEMTYFFGANNFFIEEHEQRLSLPSPDSLNAENPEIVNDGIYDMYVRCQDRNGNVNVDEYVFNFCVDPSPDTTPPVIVDTSIPSGGAVSFGTGEVSIEVYTNEPAQCKWSVQDKNFNDMETSMSCASGVRDLNAREVYTCTTTLTGIKDRQDNGYFFRCKDQPSKAEEDRNVNTQSYEYVLRGTQELNIIDVKPKNGTIKDSTDVVTVDIEVETSNGADEGAAVCSFSSTGDEGTYVIMFETNSFAHKQTLSLTEGDYTYFLRCVDAGGNSDEANVKFKVEVDNQEPQVTRAYRELDALKIVTSENANCVYSLNSCNYNFDEGISLILTNPAVKTNHFAEWKPNTVYYIKCEDEFGNQPSPNGCSLIASATNVK